MNSFDFAALDTVSRSCEGVYFPFMDLQAKELPGGARMYGPDSPQYEIAHQKARAQIAEADAKGVDGENTEKLEKVVACCIELVSCRIGDTDYSGGDKAKIREFFTRLPVMRDQMWARLVKRSNFLPVAATAGSDT